jgi:putative tryptophan/tyrosine transport system substrate-binding protein
MRRREFIKIVGGAAAWPFAARAQQQRLSVIAILDTYPPEPDNLAGVREGLAASGYVEGQNVAIEHHWANNRRELRLLAADLVRRQVAVIVAAGGIASARVAKSATTTIPIVLTVGADPVKDGLVTSLSRPGGNVTGISSIANELASKRLSLLHDLVPQARTIGYVAGIPGGTSAEEASAMVEGARLLGIDVIVIECRKTNDFEGAFASLAARGASGLIVGAFPLAFNNRSKILALAAQHRMPAIYPRPQYAYEGGLMSYSARDILRQAAVQYVARLLKGEKPGDLPVQLPTAFKLIINLKTANALALEVPRTLHVLADEVIE